MSQMSPATESEQTEQTANKALVEVLQKRVVAHERLQSRLVEALGKETWQGDISQAIAEELRQLRGHAQRQQEPFAWRWNTRADPRWRVTIERPVPNDRTAFDKIEPLYTAVSDTSTDRSPVMQAADKAAKVVEGWSDAKREYAGRVTDSSPDREGK
jgi:hypothetical protein